MGGVGPCFGANDHPRRDTDMRVVPREKFFGTILAHPGGVPPGLGYPWISMDGYPSMDIHRWIPMDGYHMDII